MPDFPQYISTLSWSGLRGTWKSLNVCVPVCLYIFCKIMHYFHIVYMYDCMKSKPTILGYLPLIVINRMTPRLPIITLHPATRASVYLTERPPGRTGKQDNTGRMLALPVCGYESVFLHIHHWHVSYGWLVLHRNWLYLSFNVIFEYYMIPILIPIPSTLFYE